MNIIINNNCYESKKGDRLLDVARTNHSHIGYFCGGNAICQTCYVKVLEGAELLSPLSDSEKAMLSDRLINEGIRMACMTSIEKEGTIRLLSVVEAVKHMAEKDPLQLPAYAGKMGWEAMVKFTDTIRFQADRENTERKLNFWQLLSDVILAINDALQFTAKELTSFFLHKPEPATAPKPKLISAVSPESTTTASYSEESNGKSATTKLLNVA
ncbi:MAG: 2Fe-2S iron-sulfur cluster-binding protein [Chlorobiaceae bacterium]